MLWLAALPAGAVGLGDMVLTSPPGQPLRVEIPVELATAQELWALQVGVASELTFLRDGRDRAPEFDELSFEIVRDSGGGSVVRMSSPNPLESSMTLLLEATWLRRPDLPPGRLIRTYTLGPEDLPESGAPPRPLGAGSLDTHGPVEAGETLWSLATRFSGFRVHPNQFLVAMFDANPRGFGGNMNGIYQGAILRIPEAVQARRLTVEEATAEVIRQLDEWLAELEARGQEPLSSGQGAGAESVPGPDQLQAELEGARQLLETRTEELQTLRTELEEARAAAQAAETVAAEARAAIPPAPPPGLRGLWIELNRAASRTVTAVVVIGLGVLLLIVMLIGFVLGRRSGMARERGDTLQPLTAVPADSGSLPTGDVGGAAESQTTMDLESRLDLARAQVDMGDTAGARRTLRTVVKAGSKAQRQQAESLLQEIESSARKETSGGADDSG
ncbi:MAG: hypothetical protein OXQ29_13330 [Rhodospirillaceae bacterium]|nr:hypothetical protein [Rhodospirillaceae bacterium]